MKGLGYVRVADEPTPNAEPHRLVDFGRVFVADLTSIGPDTKSDYAGQIERMDEWLVPIVEGVPYVESISEVHVGRFVNARAEAGAAPKTIRNYHGLLFSLMEYAVECKLRDTNPCRKTKLPDPDGFDDENGSETITFLTEDEFNLIHEGLVFDPDAQDLVTVKVGTGVRWSEISALRVRDLELDVPIPRINVRRAWKRHGKGVYARPGKGHRYIGKPKSKKVRRLATCAPVVVAALRRTAARKGPNDLVFTAPQGGPLNHAHFYSRGWLKAVKAAQKRGLHKSPRIHDLRHTHASWLISAGCRYR